MRTEETKKKNSQEINQHWSTFITESVISKKDLKIVSSTDSYIEQFKEFVVLMLEKEPEKVKTPALAIKNYLNLK